MSSDIMWNHEEPVKDLGVDVPRWIAQDISPSQVAAILQGGCASGAYMPAVTYHEALATMNEHGDEIFGYVEDLADPRWEHYYPNGLSGLSWTELAVFFVSFAVELWASSVKDKIREALEALGVEA